MKKINSLLISIFLSVFFSSCFEDSGKGSLIIVALLNKPSLPPISLENLVITDTDSSSITLAKPVCNYGGGSTPIVNAYIGYDGVISISGSQVSSSEQGPINVNSSGYKFKGLTDNTLYRIIVVAENNRGYAVKQIVQSTGGIGPVLKDLSVSAYDLDSITLDRPTFSVAGNPLPTVTAYIGVGITQSNGVVSGNIEQTYVMSGSEHEFTGLSQPSTTYTIIVVASNAYGYSVKEINQCTCIIAPVLINPSISSWDSETISIAQPTYSVAGNPAPEATAYIGYPGTILVTEGLNGSYNITGNIVDQTYDVSSSGCQFRDLTPYTNYRIIVVAHNEAGWTWKDVTKQTRGTAPELPALNIAGSDSTSITLSQVILSNQGIPAPPTVYAYLGLKNQIYRNGSSVYYASQIATDATTVNHIFGGLQPYTEYKIIVVAQNTEGLYDVKEIEQSTSATTPILNALGIAGYDSGSITLSLVTLSQSGSPAPTVTAYLGPKDQISVTGYTVSGATQTADDVTSVAHSFSGLEPNTEYKIIVVAKNAADLYSVEEKTQQTASE